MTVRRILLRIPFASQIPFFGSILITMLPVPYVLLYAFGATPKHGVLVDGVPMALETAIGFFIVGLVLLFREARETEELKKKTLRAVNRSLCETLADTRTTAIDPIKLHEAIEKDVTGIDPRKDS